MTVKQVTFLRSLPQFTFQKCKFPIERPSMAKWYGTWIKKKRRKGSFDIASRKRDSSVAHVTHTEYLIFSRPSRESAVRIINRSFWPAPDSRRTPARVIESNRSTVTAATLSRIIDPGSSRGVTETRLAFHRDLSESVPPLRSFFRIVRLTRLRSLSRDIPHKILLSRILRADEAFLSRPVSESFSILLTRVWFTAEWSYHYRQG